MNKLTASISSSSNSSSNSDYGKSDDFCRRLQIRDMTRGLDAMAEKHLYVSLCKEEMERTKIKRSLFSNSKSGVFVHLLFSKFVVALIDIIYTNIEICVHAVCYLSRLRITENDALYMLDRDCIYKTFIVALLCATKWLDDDITIDLNSYWAKALGISLGEINEMEIQFLYALEFSTTVSYTEYTSIVNQIKQTIPLPPLIHNNLDNIKLENKTMRTTLIKGAKTSLATVAHFFGKTLGLNSILYPSIVSQSYQDINNTDNRPQKRSKSEFLISPTAAHYL